jgi:transposase-like protein
MIQDFENIGLLEFLKRFSTDKDCSEYIINIRWNGIVQCPFCDSDRYYTLPDRSKVNGVHCFKCAGCKYKFQSTTHTIFHGTKLPLRTWFFLIYSIAISKKSISSRQTAKNLGITQKTAWAAGIRLRYLLKEPEIIKLSGIVEIDEAFVSKGEMNRWTRWGGITTRKAPILGMIERGGRVIIVPIPDRKRETLHDIIRNHIEPGSTIYTDGWAAYRKLTDDFFHDYVEHSSHEYVRGQVHTNTIENVWRFLKSSIRNAHHSVSEKHIEAYCHEISFRYNYRDLTFTERFNEILHRCLSGKPKILTQNARETTQRKGNLIRGDFEGVQPKVRTPDVA